MDTQIDPIDPDRMPPEPETHEPPDGPSTPDRRPAIDDDPDAQRAPGEGEDGGEQPPPMLASGR